MMSVGTLVERTSSELFHCLARMRKRVQRHSVTGLVVPIRTDHLSTTVAVEALLVAVSTDVIAPLQLTRGLVNGVKVARAGTDEHYSPHRGVENTNRRCHTSSEVLPNRGGKAYFFL